MRGRHAYQYTTAVSGPRGWITVPTVLERGAQVIGYLESPLGIVVIHVRRWQSVVVDFETVVAGRRFVLCLRPNGLPTQRWLVRTASRWQRVLVEARHEDWRVWKQRVQVRVVAELDAAFASYADAVRQLPTVPPNRVIREGDLS